MAQGIRRQLLYPLWVLLVGMALMGLLLVESNLASQKLETGKRLERLESAVSKVAIPKTLLVLELMRELSGAELLLLDGAGKLILDDSGRPLATLSPEEMGFDNGQALLESFLRVTEGTNREKRFVWKSTPYRTRIFSWGPGNPGTSGSGIPAPSTENARGTVHSTRIGNPPSEGVRVLALISEQTIAMALWQAARPLLLPLLVGGMVAFTLAVGQANRIMLRIKRIETHTKRISHGDFLPMAIPPERDELRALAKSVNRMAQQLAEFTSRLREDERLKLLGQVGAGLAHQLRNATTGARLALQLHAKACQSEPEDIQVALKQLDIMERHVGGFLNLGKETVFKRESLVALEWVKKTFDLTDPIARHANTTLQWVDSASEPGTEGKAFCPGLDHWGDSAQLEHMLQNLLTNALEAAGPGGVVKVGLKTSLQEDGTGILELDILDNGPGPSPQMAEKLFAPFATGKPEGVGLGLAVARQVARSHGGDITYFREAGWTRFHVTLARDPALWTGTKPVGLDHV